MKLIHTGDLHIGKTVNDFCLLEDQKNALQQILAIAKEEKADAIVLAGDIYDRSIPGAEAVVLLDEFLWETKKADIMVFMISGNHDSPERVSFGSNILQEQGIYIAGMYAHGEEQEMKKVSCKDAFGTVHFYLMPFSKPSPLGCKTSHELAEKLIQKAQRTFEPGDRNVLVTHFFVTDQGKEPQMAESESTIHVGGLDNVEASLFESFDYVALGHIHRAQQIGERPIYYAGAPVKHSFSEANQEKSVYVVELLEKGTQSVEKRVIRPLHEMRKIKGRIEDLTQKEVLESADRHDYIQATLTNEEELIDPIGTLRSVYPNVMQLILSKNDLNDRVSESRISRDTKSPLELFGDFFELVRGQTIDEDRRKKVEEALKEAEERV